MNSQGITYMFNYARIAARETKAQRHQDKLLPKVPQVVRKPEMRQLALKLQFQWLQNPPAFFFFFFFPARKRDFQAGMPARKLQYCTEEVMKVYTRKKGDFVQGIRTCIIILFPLLGIGELGKRETKNNCAGSDNQVDIGAT